MLAVFGWIIFRATGIPSLFHYLEGMLQWDTLRASYRFFLPNEYIIYPTNFYILFMIVVEWLQRSKQHSLEVANTDKYKWFRVTFYYALILTILSNAGSEQTFIYFQF